VNSIQTRDFPNAFWLNGPQGALLGYLVVWWFCSRVLLNCVLDVGLKPVMHVIKYQWRTSSIINQNELK
jgi:hypothetical protein